MIERKRKKNKKTRKTKKEKTNNRKFSIIAKIFKQRKKTFHERERERERVCVCEEKKQRSI